MGKNHSFLQIEKLDLKMSGNLFKHNNQIMPGTILVLELTDYIPILQ